MTALRAPIPLATLLSTLPPHTHLVLCHSSSTILSVLLTTLPSSSPLLIPTLSALAAARDANTSIAFTTSVPALRAHLAALPHVSRPASPGQTTTTTKTARTTAPRIKTLILADAAGLHAHTPSHAAQGLARTLAAAVDAADGLGAALRVVALAGGVGRFADHGGDERVDVGMHGLGLGAHFDSDGASEGSDAGDEGDKGHGHDPEGQEGDEADQWSRELLPMLESSGRAGGRAWVGRRVSVETVVGRWCVWEDG